MGLSKEKFYLRYARSGDNATYDEDEWAQSTLLMPQSRYVRPRLS